MSTSPHDPRRAALLEQVKVWRKRGRWAFLVRVVTGVVALALLGSAITLFLGTLSFMSKDFQLRRHIPGGDGSISILDSGSYVLLKPGGVAPDCVIRDLDGATLLTEPYTSVADPPEPGVSFYAEEGRYLVTCEGGQDGVGVFNQKQYEAVHLGVFAPGSPIIGLAIGGVVVYIVGRWAANRIRPEELRPTYSTGADTVGPIYHSDEGLPTPREL